MQKAQPTDGNKRDLFKRYPPLRSRCLPVSLEAACLVQTVCPTDSLICPARRALAAGVAAFPIAAAARAEDASGVASSRMSYSRFLEYLDMGRVKKVLACMLTEAACVLHCHAFLPWKESRTVAVKKETTIA